MPIRHRYFAIFGMMRTGSNLLERSINQYPDLTCHGELFNPHFIGKAKAETYLGMSITQRDSNPNQLVENAVEDDDQVIPGFRIFPDHDQRIQDRACVDPSCAKIILRRDPLDSFLSLLIAKKTDQWMLSDEAKRKSIKVDFDPEAFETYLRTRAAFYDRIETAIQKAGETAFHIQFEQLKTLALINGMARFIGSPDKLKSLREPIKKQNPDSAIEKVNNPEALAAFLGGQANHVSDAPATLRSRGTRQWIFSTHRPIAFAPLPGGPYHDVLAALATWDGRTHDPSDLAALEAEFERGVKRGDMDKRLSDRRLTHVFSVTRHPLARAYEIFDKAIFRAERDAFSALRAALVDQHDVPMPPVELCRDADTETLTKAGHGVQTHARAFSRFLRFLKLNLARKTGIPIDGMWAPQTEHLSGITSTVPLRIVADEARIRDILRFLGAPSDMALTPVAARTPTFALSDIWSPDTERLCRQAYARDYAQLGYADWVGGSSPS